MKKIHEWLAELDSHTCYDDERLRKNFREETGQEPAWRAVAPAVLNQTVGHFKGLLVPIEGNGLVAEAYVLAEMLADYYAPQIERRAFHGRGSNFWEAVRALKEANV